MLQVPGLKVIGVSGASSKRPKAPAFVWMTEAESSWAGLQSIIPNMLHLGRNRKYLERTLKIFCCRCYRVSLHQPRAHRRPDSQLQCA